jgi:NAD-dependent SIR2 family protein deacetylase
MSTGPFSHSKKVVLLLGAGASVACGLPIMRQFMRVATDRYFALHRDHPNDLAVADFATMLAFHRECRSTLWALERDWNNVEELYTQADLLRLAENSAENQARCKAIAWSIWEIYRRCEKTPPIHGICQQIVKAGLEPVIITTNYDLLSEKSILDATPKEEVVGWFYPGLKQDGGHLVVPDKAVADITPKVSGVVPIIKLHGSANWFTFGSTFYGLLDLDAVLNADRNRISSLIAGIPGVAPDPSKLVPGIVPPMLGKTTNARVYELQWQAAIVALRRARHIYVVGYSFPPTDAFMSRLLTAGLQNNDNFHSMDVVDLCDPMRHGINALLGSSLRNSGYSFWQTTAEWAFGTMSQPMAAWRSGLANQQRSARERLAIGIPF